MGWPKANEELRLYLERKSKSYIMLDPKEPISLSYTCIAEVLIDNDPSRPMLGTTSVSFQYLNNNCRRISWGQLPPVWKSALIKWFLSQPENIRGLWRIGEDEEYRTLENTPALDLPLLINKTWKFDYIQKLYIKRLKGEK